MSGETQATVEEASTVVDDGSDADFESGFGGEPAGATATPAPATPEATPEPTPAPTPAPEAPKYVQITESELTALREQSAQGVQQIAQMRGALDKAFGKVGALEQVISKLRTETPAGEKIEVSEEDFPELVKEYPEIARLQAKDLNKVLSKFRGTGSAPADLDERINQRLEAARGAATAESTERMLNAVLPGWREEVRKPEFAAWFDAQPAEVQKMQLSDDDLVAARLLRMYDRHLLKQIFAPAPAPRAPAAPVASPAPVKVSPRQRQLAGAIPVKGDGSPSPSATTEVDPFEEGFRTGRN